MTGRPEPHAVVPDESDRGLREEALEQLRRRRSLRLHLVASLIGMLLLVAIWAMTEYQNAGGWPTGFRSGRLHRDWDPWIVYPLIGGSLAFGVHAWTVFARRPPSESEIEREADRLRAG